MKSLIYNSSLLFPFIPYYVKNIALIYFHPFNRRLIDFQIYFSHYDFFDKKEMIIQCFRTQTEPPICHC